MRFRPGRRRNDHPSDLLRVRGAVILASGFFWLLLMVRPTEGALGGSPDNVDLNGVVNFYATAACVIGSAWLGSAWLGSVWLGSVWLGAAWFSRKRETKSSRIWNNLESAEARFPGSRALVVDHRLPERQQLQHQLESLGLEVAEEGNGSRASDRALNERFDVIFLSLELPIMSGESVSKLLRASGIRTPVVMVCSVEQEADGACERFEFVLTQPTDPQSVTKALQAAIPKRLQVQADSDIREDLLALDEAYSSKDFERLAVIAQKLRDCGRMMGSDDLLNSAERLEACLHEEDLQDTQLMEIRDTIGDLNSLVQDFASVEEDPERIRMPK